MRRNPDRAEPNRAAVEAPPVSDATAATTAAEPEREGLSLGRARCADAQPDFGSVRVLIAIAIIWTIFQLSTTAS